MRIRHAAGRTAFLAVLVLLPGAEALRAQRTVPRDEKSRIIDRRTTSFLDDIDAAVKMGVSARAGVYALSTDASGTVFVDIFVRGGPEAEISMASIGAPAFSRAGEWLTARVPLARLKEVRALPGVRGVELGARLTPTDDTPAQDIGLPLVRQRVRDDEYAGATGQGAIVGIVDTGIDFKHRDFIDDVTGQSRILYLWDQTLRGTGPRGLPGVNLGYGFECTQSQMGRGGQCPSKDEDGHGTHVAGIAAGDGSGSGAGLAPSYAHAGVAPEADLIVVKTSFSTPGVVDAVNYIFRRADQLGKPAVVNLSLGFPLGPHDGTSAVSLALDALSGPGRILVTTAGNEGGNLGIFTSLATHAEGVAAGSDSAVIELTIPSYNERNGEFNDLVFLQGFYMPADTFTVIIERPDGTRHETPFGQSVTTTGAAGGIVTYNGPVSGEKAALPDSLLVTSSEFPASPSRLFEAFLGEWFEGWENPAGGTWRFIFRRAGGAGSGVVDLYLIGSSIPALVTFGRGASNRRLIGPPGDAREVITVGGYVVFDDWTGSDNEQWRFNPVFGYAAGNILPYSSPGPTMDGRPKPDISAPGMVFSSLSQHSDLDINPRIVSLDRAHVLLDGTSMAAPHVTGAVALLLAVNPKLTPAQARAILQSTARQDFFTAQSFAGDATTAAGNFSWGAGKLAVAAAVAAARRQLFFASERINLAQNPVRRAPLIVRFETQPARLAVYDFAGRAVRIFAPTDLDDAQVLRWDLRRDDGHEVVNGVYLLVAELPSGLLRRKLFILR